MAYRNTSNCELFFTSRDKAIETQSKLRQLDGSIFFWLTSEKVAVFFRIQGAKGSGIRVKYQECARI
ncbi:MAG: hypothetical protein KJN62_06360 [Deltaproteobacteria bacterium]|nr:hypothetical protein [Deltaproteobacteria bacterium]